ncbi:MAG TPA: KpsF/GutQ family sugar-phosphate isomerase [Deltaproteobacteria bacterium]|nr:KpsF/GutQ family sugar-phosphate isomerase [Deltaproteobacteria bacterium]
MPVEPLEETKSKYNAILDQAADVLRMEAEGILKLADRLDDSFAEMVETIFSASGRVIIGGIGKSGIIGRKIVATLNSTGTPSLFLHPVEAMHGDLGIVCQQDVFMALSNSGETDELNVLLPSIRNMGCKIIALTGNTKSTLAKQSDIIIDVGVEREACPMGLAPTTSTIVLMAIGDALAVALINKRDFKPSDFRKYHPGGFIGQRLCSRIQDIMLTGDEVPLVSEGSSMDAALVEINRLSFGVTFVVDSRNHLMGIITDGDIRRVISKRKTLDGLNVNRVMTKNPRRVGPETPAYDALNLMEQYQITVLPITNSKGKVLGLLHLHDILGKGAFKFNGRR